MPTVVKDRTVENLLGRTTPAEDLLAADNELRRFAKAGDFNATLARLVALASDLDKKAHGLSEPMFAIARRAKGILERWHSDVTY